MVVRGERGGLRVFRNGVDMAGKPRGVFELAAETSLPLELTAGQMAIGEVRRKGQSVILISMMPATGNSQLYELTLGADGKSLSLNKSTVSTLVRSPTLALRDFNQDGLAEALLLDAEAGILSVTSWGQDENGRVRPFYVGIRPSGLATGLVDSDALPDVAVLTQMSKMTPTPIGLSIAYGLAAGELK